MEHELQFRLKKPSILGYIIGAIILAITLIGPLLVLIGFLVAYSRYKNTLITVKAGSIELKQPGKVTEMPYAKINSVSMAKIGKNTYGTLIVSLGNDIAGLRLVNVEHVDELKNVIQERIGGKGHQPAPTASNSRMDALERLAALKAKGALSKSEYDAEKARILSS